MDMKLSIKRGIFYLKSVWEDDIQGFDHVYIDMLNPFHKECSHVQWLTFVYVLLADADTRDDASYYQIRDRHHTASSDHIHPI